MTLTTPTHGLTEGAQGHFRKASGKLKACVVVAVIKDGLVKVRYFQAGRVLVNYIAIPEFIPREELTP